MALEELVIEINSKSTEGTKAIDGFIKSLKKLKTALNFSDKNKDNTSGIDSVVSKIGQIQKALDGINADKLANLATVISKVNGTKVDFGEKLEAESKKAIEAVEKVQQMLDSGFKVNPQKTTEAEAIYDPSEPSIEDSQKKSFDIGNLVKALSSLSPSFSSAAAGASKLSSAIGSIGGSEAAASIGTVASKISLVGGVISIVIGLVKKLLTLRTKLVKTTANFVGQSFSAMKTVASAELKPITDGIKKSVSGIVNKISSAGDKIKKTLASLGRVALYRAIRAALKEISQGFREGLQNVYMFSRALGTGAGSELAKSLDMIATAALYLKNSLGALAAPIINAVAPAIDYLTDKIVSLLNIINEAIAALTGAATWTKAIKYPYTYAEAAGLAAGKVKELKRTILGFDEINALNGNNDNGGGSGASSLDYSKMFTVESISSVLSTIKLLMDKGGFYEAGMFLGQRIFGGINKALDKFNAKATVAKVQKKLKDGINFIGGILDSSAAGSLGTKVGESIKTILEYASTVIDEHDTLRLGMHLGHFLNKAILAIDLPYLGTTFAKLINALLDDLYAFLSKFNAIGIAGAFANMLYNAIDGIETEKIKKALNTLVTKTLSFINTFIERFKWQNVANKLTDTLRAMLGAVNWSSGDASLGGTIGKLFNGVLDFLTTAASNFPVTEACDALFGTIGRMLNAVNWSQVGSLLTSLAQNAFAALELAAKDLDLPNFANNLATSINAFIRNTDWEAIGKNLNGFFGSVLDSLAVFIEKFDVDRLVRSIYVLLYGLDTDEIRSKILGILMSIANKVLDGFWTLTVAQNRSYAAAAFEKLASAYVGAKGAVSNVWNGIKGAFDSVKSFFGFADGGYPEQGSAFIAGEVPGEYEFVGDINGRTGVVSGREISGIGEAIREGTAALSALLRQGNEYAKATAAKDYSPTVSVTDINNAQYRNNRRLGTTVAALSY